MNFYKELNKVLDYIEEHLTEKIEYKTLAQMMGLNEYTFQKLFSVVCNITIAEYIRDRRLSMSGQDLKINNEKIIDVAIKYQYKNPAAFSRAFQKFHGINPSKVNVTSTKLKMLPRIYFNETMDYNTEIEYSIVQKERMILYGKCKYTNIQNINIDAAAFFKEIKKQYGDPLYGLVQYKNIERTEVESYWVLYEENRKGFQKKEIPKSKWISIKINSRNEKDIQQTVKFFYKKFLPSTNYVLKDIPELEYYHKDFTEFLIAINN